MKDSNDLIRDLAKNHRPVSRDLPPEHRTVLALLFTVAVAVTVTTAVTPLSFAAKTPVHGLELGVFAALVLAASHLGFRALVPGEPTASLRRKTLLLALLLGVVFLFRAVAPQASPIHRPYCPVEGLAVSIATTFLFHRFFRRSALGPGAPGAFTLLFALPLVATVIHHGSCDPGLAHLFVCHGLAPFLVPGAYFLLMNRKNRATLAR
jgi:hypothetical protein